MIQQSPWRAVCEFVITEALRSFDEIYQEWTSMLQAWLDDLLSDSIPDDWHERLDQFVADTEQMGLEILPDSIRTLEELIESRIVPADKLAGGEREQALAAHDKVPDAVDPIREFDKRLGLAKRKLETLRQLLAVIGEKLDAGKPGENVDIDYEVGMIAEYLRGYNEDLEAARDVWLRYGLATDDVRRLTEMLNPASLGLPAFADEEQGKRAFNQIAEIGKRLGSRDAALGAAETVLQGADRVGTVAGILAGGGAIYTAGKVGGKWAVAKVVAGTGAAIVADHFAEKGLRAAGVSDQTIRGAKLAAAVVSFILLRRASTRAAAAPEPTPQAPEPPPPRPTKPPGGEPPSRPRGGGGGAGGGSDGGTPHTPPSNPAGQPTKPPLPSPKDEIRYTWPGHRGAAEGEGRLAHAVHDLPDEWVVSWGRKIGNHGDDVTSVNIKTGEVTLWDNKYRSAPRTIQHGSAFQKQPSLDFSVERAIAEIEGDTQLPGEIKQIALQNLRKGRFRTITAGDGNARNSTIRYHGPGRGNQ